MDLLNIFYQISSKFRRKLVEVLEVTSILIQMEGGGFRPQQSISIRMYQRVPWRNWGKREIISSERDVLRTRSGIACTLIMTTMISCACARKTLSGMSQNLRTTIGC